MAQTSRLSLSEIEELRRQTPGCGHRLHLNNAGAALMSRATVQAMTDHLELEALIGGYEAADQARAHIDATYDHLAKLVGGASRQIALFDNSTHAWNAGFYSMRFDPGDRILTGRDEYGSNVLAYLQVARRTGVDVVVVPNDETGQIDVAALANLMDHRVKLIGLTWVPTSGGLVNPAAAVGRIARDADVVYLLDATQAVGQFGVNVAELGCDLLTGTGRKFLRAPRGTGFLFVSDRALDRLDPYVVEIRSATWDGHRSFTWAEGARRFETWENSYVNIIGLGAAVSQALDIGLGPIGARAYELGARLRSGLAALSGVTIADLGVDQCAIVTAAFAGRDARDVAVALAAARINVSTTVPEHTQFDTEDRAVHPLVRMSPHYYNTEAEIDRAIGAVDAISNR
jgi:selenocysteine lyase/cysteine desulfurase